MFKKVQFIGVALCTTPSALKSIEEISDEGYYAGIDNDKEDIIKRIDFVKECVNLIFSAKEIDTSKETLKIIAFPEFFMRGVLGAYYSTDPYYSEKIVTIYLKQMAEDFKKAGVNIGKDYLFVLGTVLSSTSKIDYTLEPNASLYQTGDNLLNIYYRLHSTEMNNTEKIQPSLYSILKIIDNEEVIISSEQKETVDKEYVDILQKTLDYCDTRATLDVCNRCLVYSGSNLISYAFNKPTMIQKKYKSKEDFILNSKNCDKVTHKYKYLQTTSIYPPIDTSQGELKKEPFDGLSILEYEGLKIGIEICLDHSRQRLVNHLYKNPKDYVDLQIVISCGMSVREKSVIAKQDGYIFNCDGEYELRNNEKGVDGRYCHTSLQKVQKKIEVANQKVLTEANLSNAYPLSGQINGSVSGKVPLYPFKNYQIHIYAPLDLKK